MGGVSVSNANTQQRSSPRNGSGSRKPYATSDRSGNGSRSSPPYTHGSGFRPRQKPFRSRPQDQQQPVVPLNATQPSSDSQSSSFGSLQISVDVAKALREIGYTTPTPIQEAVIPAIRNGQDVVGQAQTGTGKTAAFGIPLVASLDPQSNTIQALVLVPTRELAVQVRGELTRLSKFRGLRSVAVYGGQSINRQLEAFRRGVHIIIATPGRLIDHLGRGTVQLEHLSFVVLDEADQMLDIGFADDINRILRHVPSSRQTLLFSATMPSSIKKLAYRYMRNPAWILVGKNAEPVAQVDQVYFEVAERDRYTAIEELLSDPRRVIQALVFRRTKIGVDRLTSYLNRRGHDVQAIHGDLTQAQRDAVMARFRAKKLRLLIATNVAARGLDIPAVSHVINYDMPSTVEEYIHRIGRTARMGQPGTAITFVSEWDFEMLDAIRAHVGEELKGQRLGIYSN